MLEIIYEDNELMVVKKPAGLESQSSRGFEPDMVSRIRNYIHRLSPQEGEPYVGVIHRLDKPVAGIMVYARTAQAAAALSRQVQSGQMKKTYHAVICGRPVDNVDNFVDYLLKDSGQNMSRIVEKGTKGAKRAELRYRVLKTIEGEPDSPGPLTLVEIELLTGRHHQIRVQFAGRGMPIWGDRRYGLDSVKPGADGQAGTDGRIRAGRRTESDGRTEMGGQLALCASRLSFLHPVTGRELSFSMKPSGEIFEKFKILL